MPRYLVERTFSEAYRVPPNEVGAQLCMELVAANTVEFVTWIQSYISTDGKKVFCVYEGPTPEAVRLAASRNKLPIDRIVEVRILDPWFHF